MTVKLSSSLRASLALKVIAQVKEDMARGVVPTDAQSFAQLHDYVDANEYLINALDAEGIEHDAASEAQADLLNATMTAVNVWLEARN